MKSIRLKRRRAFSLLEVLLALGLSFVVLFGITMAIDLHLRMLDKRQAEIESTQLSRSVLRLIREDVHGAVQYTPFDTSALEELIAGIDPLTADMLAAEVTGEELTPEQIADAAAESSDPPEEEESTAADDVISSAYPPTRPGVYGNETSLSIDVSRLPRRDQLMFPVSSGINDQLPSDIKTIAYYVGTVATQPGQNTNATPEVQTGLIRREVDRAVSRYATDQGGTVDLTSAEDLIAPEVTQILFSYFDGNDWQTSWDSDEIGRLPVAIRVIIQIGGDPDSINNQLPVNNAKTLPPEVHQMTVYLPISEIPPDLEVADE